ncbi:methylenetetrahydrofolate reductase C-terminal domain-containing protein [Demequina mangrovi]|uniref:5,10-methylenetetrahydrofolate reductase n=1 Tax=Demequina mangrovi TaxID=1043493 RepID=A0A1H7A1R4_9MICO|nr:methylenetetrahydrofolate reductase C-terminal domain-containing protein [Demequina mangrovi]SEJ59633.1 5,10-methylenetetrahydrofolate reductase [Demequina mangrovi]
METCPKRMEYGPCGGVGPHGECEAAPEPCVFLGAPVRRWAGIDGRTMPERGVRTAAAAATLARLDAGRVIVADMPALANGEDALRRCARILRDGVDVTLAGDAPDARVQLPPSLRAAIVQEEGLSLWAGVNARDRNRVALEGELAGLRVTGAGAVNCVTGDHPHTGHRPDAMPVFDLDATELAALARAQGHAVAVAAAPSRGPVDARVPLLLEKERAGAEVCFVDHCGGSGPVGAFVAAARAAGSSLRFVPCVPVVTSRAGAALLASFPGFAAPPGYLEELGRATDARSAGIAAAVRLAEQMLEVDGVAGVDLSGGAGPGEEEDYAEALAEIGSRLR